MIYIKSSENNIVMKNNMIVKAKYNISTIENRIFLLLLFKLQMSEEKVLTCDIPIEEFKEILKKKSNQTQSYIEYLLVKLRKQSIYFKDDEGWGEYGFINGHKYIKETKSFKIEASKVIHSYIRDYLKTGYTPVNLAVFFSLINPNAQRLYDLLRLWSGSKYVITYNVDELKELLMLENKYSRYNDFKRRVIEPAVKELNNSGYFNIEVTENKVGRKVETIDFTVDDLDKRIYFKKDDDNLSNKNNNINSGLNKDNNSNNNFYKDSKLENKQLSEEVNLCDKDIIIVEESDCFYVPNKKLFTDKTLELFKNDFRSHNFEDKNLKNKFYESIGTTLDKVNDDKIKIKSYNYFKATLNNKINQSEIEKPQNIKQTKFHNFDETFSNYSDEEFENIVMKSQQMKFG